MGGGELLGALETAASFSEQACRMVIVQIASALAHLHLRHRIAHLDLKPANVLCRSADLRAIGCVKLCDYGFCRPFSSRTAREFTVNCGTMEYFAPELVDNYLSHKRRKESGVTAPPRDTRHRLCAPSPLRHRTAGRTVLTNDTLPRRRHDARRTSRARGHRVTATRPSCALVRRSIAGRSAASRTSYCAARRPTSRRTTTRSSS
eukprot:253586-Prymnesium_polylepis.1